MGVVQLIKRCAVLLIRKGENASPVGTARGFSGVRPEEDGLQRDAFSVRSCSELSGMWDHLTGFFGAGLSRVLLS